MVGLPPGGKINWDTGIGYVGQNLFLVSVILDYAYSSICYDEQNLMWDYVVKFCKTGCYPCKKIISEFQ